MRITRLALFVLAVPLSGCLSYQVMADPAASLQASPSPVGRARITMRSGEQFKLHSPRVVGDSLRGSSSGVDTVSVLMADVAVVEVQKTNALQTAGVVVGGAAAVFGWLLVGFFAYMSGG